MFSSKLSSELPSQAAFLVCHKKMVQGGNILALVILFCIDRALIVLSITRLKEQAKLCLLLYEICASLNATVIRFSEAELHCMSHLETVLFYTSGVTWCCYS